MRCQLASRSENRAGVELGFLRRLAAAAILHTELLRTTTVNNKTNGVTPRRWLLLANPGLSNVISAAIGNQWILELEELRRLVPLANDSSFCETVHAAKRAAKCRLVDWLRNTFGLTLDPDAVFDCHIKRIHEYKRQLLNALRIVVLYNRLRADPGAEPEVRAALDAIAADAFSPTEPGIFRPLHDALIAHGDYYMHLADLQSYLCADARLSATYRVRESWTRMAILNIAASGYFSSDRTVAQYASDIWDATPCPILHAP
jgi:glucan phosphorylase